MALTDGIHMYYYRRFFHVFKTLEGNETRVKTWLEEIRRPKRQRSWATTACLEAGEVYDYIDQLKALMQDTSMMLRKSK